MTLSGGFSSEFPHHHASPNSISILDPLLDDACKRNYRCFRVGVRIFFRGAAKSLLKASNVLDFFIKHAPETAIERRDRRG